VAERVERKIEILQNAKLQQKNQIIMGGGETSRYDCVTRYDPATATKSDRIRSCNKSSSGAFSNLQTCVEACSLSKTESTHRILNDAIEEVNEEGVLSNSNIDLGWYAVFFTLTSTLSGISGVIFSFANAINSVVCNVVGVATKGLDSLTGIATRWATSLKDYFEGKETEEAITSFIPTGLITSLASMLLNQDFDDEFLLQIANEIRMSLKETSAPVAADWNVMFSTVNFDSDLLNTGGEKDQIKVIIAALKEGRLKDMEVFYGYLRKFMMVVTILLAVYIVATSFTINAYGEEYIAEVYLIDDNDFIELAHNNMDKLEKELRKMESCLINNNYSDCDSRK
jgi:hypothetical protein